MNKRDRWSWRAESLNASGKGWPWIWTVSRGGADVAKGSHGRTRKAANEAGRAVMEALKSVSSLKTSRAHGANVG